MAEKNQAKADNTSNADMTLDYNKGMSPDDIAEKYGIPASEVVEIVTKPVAETSTITQAEIDEQEAKKGK